MIEGQVPSDTLFLLALGETNGKNLRSNLQYDLCQLTGILSRKGIYTMMGFRPNGDDRLYSEQFCRDEGFLMSSNAMDCRHVDSHEARGMLYFTNYNILEDANDGKSVHWCVSDGVGKSVQVKPEIVEEVKKTVKEYYAGHGKFHVQSFVRRPAASASS